MLPPTRRYRYIIVLSYSGEPLLPFPLQGSGLLDGQVGHPRSPLTLADAVTIATCTELVCWYACVLTQLNSMY